MNDITTLIRMELPELEALYDRLGPVSMPQSDGDPMFANGFERGVNSARDSFRREIANIITRYRRMIQNSEECNETV
jgi:hypothetical protein